MLGKIKDFIKVILLTRNWAELLRHKFLEKKVKVVWRKKEIVNPDVFINDFTSLMNYVNFFWHFPGGRIDKTIATINFDGRIVKMDFGWLGPNALSEVFSQEVYGQYLKNLDLSNKVVVDIGAAFGDSSIYFSIHNAKTVVSMEPVPSFAKLVKNNIALNNFEDKCVLINAAIGSKKLDSILDDPQFGMVFEGYSNLFSEFKNVSVPVITLQEVVDKFRIKDGVLKIDCEGWEYDILLNADIKLLRSFEVIFMEYHYGFEGLKNKLSEAGFVVKYTEPVFVHVPERKEEYQKMEVGFICATRK